MTPEQELIKETDDAIDEDLEGEMKEEAIEEDIDAQQEIIEDNQDPGQMPEEQQSVLDFLEKILTSPDRFMTGYLTWEELGKPTFSTRFWLNLSNTCENLFNMKIVGEYCRMKARVTSDTSLSREGFMVNTSVTQKKVKEKKSSSDLAKFLSAGKGKS